MKEQRQDNKRNILHIRESQAQTRAEDTYTNIQTDLKNAIGLSIENDTDGHNAKGQT